MQADSWRGSPVNSAVSSAIGAAINTSLPTNPQRSNMDTSPWKPQGVLIMHMAEHKAAVNKITVSANATFFASASDDGTVKIWDSRRLEQDAIFRSRLTYESQVNIEATQQPWVSFTVCSLDSSAANSFNRLDKVSKCLCLFAVIYCNSVIHWHCEYTNVTFVNGLVEGEIKNSLYSVVGR